VVEKERPRRRWGEEMVSAVSWEAEGRLRLGSTTASSCRPPRARGKGSGLGRWQGRTQVELSGGLGPHSNLANPFEFCINMFRICGFTIEVPPVKVYAPTGYFLWVRHWSMDFAAILNLAVAVN
jgi:hypothetical protein